VPLDEDHKNMFKTKHEIFIWLQNEGFAVPNHGKVKRENYSEIQIIKDRLAVSRAPVIVTSGPGAIGRAAGHGPGGCNHRFIHQNRHLR